MSAPPTPSRWGGGVVAAFGVFIAGVLAMAYIAMSERVDLVSDQYYDQGVRYQERITAERNSVTAGGVTVVVLPRQVRLEFPREVLRNGGGGTVTFYRPADRSRDFALALAVDSSCSQTVPTGDLERGLWRVKATWTTGGVAHYYEQAIMIQQGF